MSLKTKRTIQIMIRYTVLTAVGIFMIYPLLWMIGATFKPNNEIFSGLNILPKKATFEGYINAMKNYGGDINIWKAMLNYVQYFRMGRFKALSATYCAFNVCDRDLFCIHAYSVFKKYT